MKLKFIIALSIVFAISQLNLNAQVHVQDSLALVDLYNSTDGPHWKKHTNWLTSVPVNNWFGITVFHHHVQDISLSGNTLSGEIPSSLGDLKSLVFLDLGHNQLSGQIPSSLGTIPALADLFLNDNQFSGEIPSSLGNDTLFTFLYLDHNQLSGRIPASFGKLHSIFNLKLNNNKLSGRIPDIGNIGKYQSAVYIDLSFNLLRDIIPSDFANIAALNELRLSHNKLSGSISPSFAKLKQLSVLDISNNILSGTAPSFLANVRKTRKLTLSIRNNYYTFDGMEELVPAGFHEFLYAGQRPVQIHLTNNIFSVQAGGTLYNNTYKWYKDGSLVATIQGDSTYQPVTDGNYSVEVTNSIATKLTLYSNRVSFAKEKNIASSSSGINVNAAGSQSVLLYPNPAKTITNINFTATGKYVISIIDTKGHVLQTKTGNSNSKQNYLQLNINSLAVGVYLIIISDESDNRQSLKLNKE